MANYSDDLKAQFIETVKNGRRNALTKAIKQYGVPEIKVGGLDVAKPIFDILLPRVYQDDGIWGHRQELTVIREIEQLMRKHPDGFTVVFKRNQYRLAPRFEFFDM